MKKNTITIVVVLMGFFIFMAILLLPQEELPIPAGPQSKFLKTHPQSDSEDSGNKKLISKTTQNPSSSNEDSVSQKKTLVSVQVFAEESEYGFSYQRSSIEIYLKQDFDKWTAGKNVHKNRPTPLVVGEIKQSGVFNTRLPQGSYHITTDYYEALTVDISEGPVKVKLRLSRLGESLIQDSYHKRKKVRVNISFQKPDGSTAPARLGLCKVYEIPADLTREGLTPNFLRHEFEVFRPKHSFVIRKGFQCVVLYRSYSGQSFKLDLGIVDREVHEILQVDVEGYQDLTLDLPESLLKSYEPFSASFSPIREDRQAVYLASQHKIANVKDGDIVLWTLQSKETARRAFVLTKIREEGSGFRAIWIGRERAVSGQLFNKNGQTVPNKKIFISSVDKTSGRSQSYHLTDENGRFSFSFFCDIDTAIQAERLYFTNIEGDKEALTAYQELKSDQEYRDLRLIYK